MSIFYYLFDKNNGQAYGMLARSYGLEGHVFWPSECFWIIPGTMED